MKLVIKLLLLSLCCLSIISLNLKGQTTTSFTLKEDFSKQWKELFTTSIRPPQSCSPPDQSHKIDNKDNNNNEDGSDPNMRIPRQKPNKWARQQGFGPSAYLFDFLDDIFMNEIISNFNQMWQAAKKIQPVDAKVYEEPYTLNKMVFVHSQGVAGSSNITVSGNENELLEIIQKYNKDFNPQVWKNSISASQMYSILQNWGWDSVQGDNPPKKLLDTFDFDGDGRLNPSEFILMSIIHNKKVFRQPNCKQYCYNETIINKIDPIFSFSDCEGDGLISAENMWANFINLKRKDPNKYSIYQCQMPTKLNKGYRTTSCNDFILKNFEAVDGFLNLAEFRAGILLGYWDRYTDALKVITDESKSLKDLRWGDAGSKDIVCENIISLIPKASENVAPAKKNK